jgi:hypothetical protein
MSLHGEALKIEIARKAADHAAEFHRIVRRLETLAGYVSLRVAQLDWLHHFPAAGPDVETEPLVVAVGQGREVDVGRLLGALRGVQLDQRVVATAAATAPRRDRRRGAAPSMAALSDASVSVTDLALELDIDRRKVWQWLNGHMPARLERLRPALERLVGADQAAAVLEGIPQHPRARASPSGAIVALHDAGATAEDFGTRCRRAAGERAAMAEWMRPSAPGAR